MKKHRIHQSQEDIIAANSNATVSSIDKIPQKMEETTKAIKDLHHEVKDKSVEIEGFTGVVKNLKKNNATLNTLKEDINNPQKVVQKLEEVKSAGLITNKLLKEIKEKEVPKQEFPKEIGVNLKGISIITLKGDKGDTPTEKELVPIIKKLIPPPIAGYSPVKGKDYFDGKDYILTNKDKKEIAKTIDVPIIEKVIEKTETIVEKPIIKEVAMHDTPDEVVGKINSALKKIDPKAIRGLQEIYNTVDLIGKYPGEGAAVGGGTSKINYRDSTGVIISAHVTDIKFSTGITSSYSNGQITLSAAAGSGGHIIEDEGIPLTQRDTMNFVGAGVAVTDAGGKTIVTIGGGTPGGSDTQVQFNDGGVFGGDAGLVFNKTTNVLTTGEIYATAGYIQSAGTTPYFDLYESDTLKFGGIFMSGGKLNLYADSPGTIRLNNTLELNSNTINGNIVPSTGNTYYVGSGTLPYASLYLSNSGYIDFGNGTAFISNSGATTLFGTGVSNGVLSSFGNFDFVLQTGNATTGNITIVDGVNGDISINPNGSGVVVTDGTIRPATNDDGSLGISGTAFADLFLASGAVINFNAGNATITHSAGLLTSNVDIAVPDEVYGVGWNASLEVPTKNAVYDQMELKSNSSGALTQFVGNGNWKVWYSDGSGDVQELALGADGTFLKSNGAAVAPTFATPAGSGDMVLANAQTNSGIKTFLNTTMKLRNVANTFDGYFVNTNTADRIYTLKDAAGTIAFVSDITGTNSGTNTGDQTTIVGITGTKAQFNTAVSDGDIVYLDSIDTITGLKTMSGLNAILHASSGLTIRNPADTFKYTFTAAAIAADRILTLPLTAGTLALTSDITGTNSGTNTGDQTIANTSDATSHTVTLSASGGSVQLIEGANITLTTGGTGSVGTVTIASTGGSGAMTWTEVTGTSASMTVNNGYIANNAGLVTLTLPDTAAVGSIVRVTGKGAGGWRIAQNALEQIIWNEGGLDGTDETTIGVGGRLDSTDDYDSIELICFTANTTWGVLSSKGNITIT